MLSNGIEVAVKRLSKKSGKGIREFKNEAAQTSLGFLDSVWRKRKRF